MDTPLREHIPKERCILSDKVQQGEEGGCPNYLAPTVSRVGGRGENRSAEATTGVRYPLCDHSTAARRYCLQLPERSSSSATERVIHVAHVCNKSDYNNNESNPLHYLSL